MFDIGKWEFLLVFIITIVLVKPEDIPNVLRSIGKALQKLRDFSFDIFSNFEKWLEDEDDEDEIIEETKPKKKKRKPSKKLKELQESHPDIPIDELEEGDDD